MPAAVPPNWNVARARSYVFRLPLLTRCFLGAIVLFWILGLQSVFDVRAWGSLDPDQIGFLTCRFSPPPGIATLERDGGPRTREVPGNESGRQTCAGRGEKTSTDRMRRSAPTQHLPLHPPQLVPRIDEHHRPHTTTRAFRAGERHVDGSGAIPGTSVDAAGRSISLHREVHIQGQHGRHGR